MTFRNSALEWAEETVPFPEALDSDGVLIIHDGALTEHLVHHLDLDPTREQQKQLGIICLANQTSVWIRSPGSGKGNTGLALRTPRKNRAAAFCREELASGITHSSSPVCLVDNAGTSLVCMMCVTATR